MASPRRPVVSPPPEEELAPPPPQPKLGLAGRGLAGRPLGRPIAEPEPAPAALPAPYGLSSVERDELNELRAETERIRRDNEELRIARTKLKHEIEELQNQNAQLIEDHTRDMLTIKAKETQIVRARSDAEAAEQTVHQQRREIERLKRELSRQVRANSPPPNDLADMYPDPASNGGSGRYGDIGYGGVGGGSSYRQRSFQSQNPPGSPGAEGKENAYDSLSRPSSTLSGKLSPLRPGVGSTKSSTSSHGRTITPPTGETREMGGGAGERMSGYGASSRSQAASGAESWKRAAEVTQNLKQRIEMMKVSFTVILT